MKKILSAFVFVMCLGVFNFCSALSIDKAAFICHEKTFMFIGDVMIEELDFYIDLSENSGVWEYPSGQQSILVTTFYFEPITKTIITDKHDPYKPWEFEFIKDKNGQWGFRSDTPEHRDNRKYIKKISAKGFYVVNDYYNTMNNRYPLSVLKKVGEYIDLDSFPSI